MLYGVQFPFRKSDDGQSIQFQQAIRVADQGGTGNVKEVPLTISRFGVPSNNAVPTTKTALTLTPDTGMGFRIPAGTLAMDADKRYRKLCLVPGFGINLPFPSQACTIRVETEGGTLLWAWHVDGRKCPGQFPSDLDSCLELDAWAYVIGGTNSALNLRTHAEYRLTGNSNTQLIEPWKSGGVSLESYPTGIDGTVDINLVMSIQWDVPSACYAVTRTAGRFGMVTSSGDFVRTSRQGTSQTYPYMTASDLDVLKAAMRSISYNGLIHIATGVGGAISRSMCGQNWCVCNSGTTQPLYSSCWAEGLGLFVAVGDQGTILTSPDGRVWTSRTSGTTSTLFCVRYNSSVGLIAGSSSANEYLTSPDGTTWTKVTANVGFPPRSITLNGTSYVFAGAGGAVQFWNGSAWTLGITTGGFQFRDGVFDSTVGKYVLVGDSGTMYTSSNGTTWASATSGATGTIYGIAASAGLYLAVGDQQYVAYSTNATTWTRLKAAANSAGTFWGDSAQLVVR